MSPKFKILLATLIIITLSVVSYAIFIARKQLAPQTTETVTTSQQNTTPYTSSSETSNTETPTQDTIPTENNLPTPEPSTPPETVPFIPQTLSDPNSNPHVYMPISKISCDNNCHQFTKESDVQYCQQYCGFVEPDTIENCSDLKNLKQDYCFKGQAINKTDPTICKKITDDNIRIACQNRVLEDVVDKAKQAE